MILLADHKNATVYVRSDANDVRDIIANIANDITNENRATEFMWSAGFGSRFIDGKHLYEIEVVHEDKLEERIKKNYEGRYSIHA